MNENCVVLYIKYNTDLQEIRNTGKHFPTQGYQNGSGGGGVTLHTTGYAPKYTKSVENGSFLTYNIVNVVCKKGIFFCC